MKNVKKLAIMMLATMLVGTLLASEVSSIACKPLLSITAPSSVYEYQSFLIRVKFQNNPISGAMVTIKSGNQTYFSGTTDFSGYVYPVISGIDQTKTMTITATKTGYQQATKGLVVYPAQLFIVAPSSVYENEQFTVHVTSHNESVAGAYVDFNGMEHQTNQNGTTNFVAPAIENMSESFIIFAHKFGYFNATVSITVMKETPQNPELFIQAPDYAYEYQDFMIMVSCENNSIPGALVTISAGNQTYYTNTTNEFGFVFGYIYGISHSMNMTIMASKSGYESATHVIYIINQ
jgi:hypothetical protein